jgi:GMP synthase (glutamine-hydrolysing)
MRLHYLQHVAIEGLGSIEAWATARGHDISNTRLYNDELLPELTAFDWLIVMGGPMNIYEEGKYPWLAREKRFIRAAIDAAKVVIGICLGAQLVADVLGAKVTRNPEKEIGWFPIRWTVAAQTSPLFSFLPREQTVFHWHGDTFDMPQGATLLASSIACRHQAFLYGDRVIGMQFHLETRPEDAKALINVCADEMISGRFVQTPEQLLPASNSYLDANRAIAGIMNRLYVWIEEAEDK